VLAGNFKRSPLGKNIKVKTALKTAVEGDLSIAYRVKSTPGAHAVIFIHGLGADSRFFQKQINYFSPCMTALSLDLPGHGNSTGTGTVSMDRLVDALLLVLRTEGIEKATLAGHSLGGAVALEFYFRYPSMVEAMVLISTGAHLPVSPFLDKHLGDDPAEFYPLLVGAIFSKKRELMIAMAQKNLHLFDGDFFKANLALCRETDFSGRLADVSVPVLAVANRDDRLVPAEMTEQMAAAIPGGEFILLEAGGHVPFFEYPELFDREVERFLDKHFRGSTPLRGKKKKKALNRS